MTTPATQFGHATTGVQVVQTFPSAVLHKNFVITGTSAGGTGAETAISLAHARPARLFLLARSRPKVEPVIEAIRALSPDTQVFFIQTEMSDLTSVRAAAGAVNAELGGEAIAALFNSAGGLCPSYATGKEGVELTLTSVYLGHWELTSHLMHGGPRTRLDMKVINVASNGHGICPFRPDDYNFGDGKEWHRWAAYGQAKTAQMLFSVGLARRGMVSFSLHPGLVLGTGATGGLGVEEGRVCDEVARRFAGHGYEVSGEKSVQEGCATGLRAGLDGGLLGETEGGNGGWNGCYLEDCQIKEPYEYARDEEVAERLWALTEGWVGHRFEEPVGVRA